EARFETAAARFQGEEALKNLGPFLRDAVWVRTTQEGTKIRVLKLRRPAGAGAKAPAFVPRPAPAAAPDKSLPATPARAQTAAGRVFFAAASKLQGKTMSNFRKVALLSALAFAGATSAHAQAASADASPTPDIAKASAPAATPDAAKSAGAKKGEKPAATKPA